MRPLALLMVIATAVLGLTVTPAAGQAGRQAGPRPCTASAVTDPAEDGRLDVVRVIAEWRCEEDLHVFRLQTADQWTLADIEEVAIVVDTDGDLTNGCREGDYLLYGVNPAGDGVEALLGSLYRYDDCEIAGDDRLGGVGWQLTGGDLLTVTVPESAIGTPALVRAYAQLEAREEDSSTADFAPDRGQVTTDTRDLADPGSVAMCIGDDTGDVVRRTPSGSQTVDAPELDLTQLCTWWGTHLAVEATVPALDIRGSGAGTSMTALVNLQGDAQAERIIVVEWDGLAFTLEVQDGAGQPVEGCDHDRGRVLVTQTQLRAGEMDPACLGDQPAGISPGFGRSDGEGTVTFDRAGPSSYTPIRRAAALDPAEVGTRPDPSEVASPATAPQPATVQRLEGPARIETSIAISRDAWPEGAAAAVLARQDVEADALAGAALASAVGAPLLLTTSSQVPDAVATELRRIVPPGGRVYVLGGPVAIDDQVLADVQQLGFGAQRLAGEDRFETAAAVAEEAASYLDELSHILIADGIEFQWALIAGAAAGASDGVVLTTASAGLIDRSQAFVDANPQAVVTAIGPRATTAEPDVRSIDADGDPYATSVLLAQEFFDGAAGQRAVVASGEQFPDGLGGGAFAASLGGPLLLSRQDQLPPSVRDHLSSVEVQDVHLLGGPVALSAAVEDALRQLTAS